MLSQLIFLSPFVFPLYLIRFEAYGIPFTVLEAYLYLIFGIWLFEVAVRKFKFAWEKPSKQYILAAFLLLMGATAGVIMSPDYISLPSLETLDAKRVAMGVWKGWIFAPMLYFVVLVEFIKSSLSLKKLLRYFVYSSALVAIISYALGIFGDGFTYDLRLSGFFESANYLSLYLVPPLLISITFLFQRIGKAKKHDYYDLASLVIMAHALFFTQSYAAIIGVFGAVCLSIIYVIFKKASNKRNAIFGFITLIVAFCIVLLTQINTQKFQQFLDWENRSSTSVRLEIYEVAWGLVDENPLVGVGPGLFQANYQVRAPEILGKAPMEWNIPHPHNVFFAFWLGAGLLGLISLLIILVLVHRQFTYPLVALWGVLIHGLFDTPFWKNDLAVIFWLVVASIVILQTHGINTSKKQKNPIRRKLTPRVSNRARVRE